MTYADGFVEVKPGFLVDPALRLRLHSGGSSGLALNDAYLVMAYDPEIRADRLLVAPSDAQRAWRLSSPVTAPAALQNSDIRIRESRPHRTAFRFTSGAVRDVHKT